MRQPPEKLVTGSFVCASVKPRPIRQGFGTGGCGPQPAFPERRARSATTGAPKNRRHQRASRHVAQRTAWICPRAVSADEPRLLARIERERGLFEERFGAAGKAELVEANHGVETQASTGKRYFRLARVVAAGSLTLARCWPFDRMFFDPCFA